MGKGDKKTKRGKIIKGSYGVRRPKKTSASPIPVKAKKKTVKKEVELIEEKPELKKTPVKKPAAKKTPAKKTEEKPLVEKLVKAAPEKEDKAVVGKVAKAVPKKDDKPKSKKKEE